MTQRKAKRTPPGTALAYSMPNASSAWVVRIVCFLCRVAKTFGAGQADAATCVFYAIYR